MVCLASASKTKHFRSELSLHFICVFTQELLCLITFIVLYHSCVKNYSWSSVHVFTEIHFISCYEAIHNVFATFIITATTPSILVKVVSVFL